MLHLGTTKFLPLLSDICVSVLTPSPSSASLRMPNLFTQSRTFHLLQACLGLGSGFCNLFRSPVLHSCNDIWKPIHYGMHALLTGLVFLRLRREKVQITPEVETALPGNAPAKSSCSCKLCLHKERGTGLRTAAWTSGTSMPPYLTLDTWDLVAGLNAKLQEGYVPSPGAQWGFNIESSFLEMTLRLTRTLKTSLCQCKAFISSPKGKEYMETLNAILQCKDISIVSRESGIAYAYVLSILHASHNICFHC